MNFLELKKELQNCKLPDHPQRLFYGRGGSFSHNQFLNIDWYKPNLFVTIYCKPSTAEIAELLKVLQDTFPLAGIIIQERTKSGIIFHYDNITKKVFTTTEHELRYEINLGNNQNSGFFIDMRPLRHWVANSAKSAKVLNLFSYTCSFSVVAIAGDANEVLNVDMSSSALNWGRRNHRLNGHDLTKVKFWKHNILKSFAKIGRHGKYDLIVVDPPNFQGKSFSVERDYPKILRRIPNWLADNGKAVICLNSPHFSYDDLEIWLKDNAPQLTITQRLTSGSDFPEENPDHGLKIVICQKC